MSLHLLKPKNLSASWGHRLYSYIFVWGRISVGINIIADLAMFVKELFSEHLLILITG